MCQPLICLSEYSVEEPILRGSAFFAMSQLCGQFCVATALFDAPKISCQGPFIGVAAGCSLHAVRLAR